LCGLMRLGLGEAALGSGGKICLCSDEFISDQIR